ncbi:hypothetical protein G4Z16_12645 [Streptomyces bathyalis]|uniref:Serine/threonine protein kinase n=1 Tax=Streptomyces bathyalis TaxID=2710756 RepID=A0A7T1T649_9ACTN|nr:hypothetical protein [Streptomyces bathyalis]QPP07096.1 hypothetical protein G4Z16_12645 [Streptomyces bathyalis]
MALLVGAGASSGILMNREDARDNRASDNQVSQYKMVDTGASPEPSVTTEAASPKLKKKKKAKSPSPSTSKPATSAPAKPKPPEDPSPGNGLPAGFRTVVDDRGFSLAVMKGWDRRELSPTQVGYMPPTGDEYLQISEVEGAPRASFINYLEMEQAMQESSNGYERISLSHVEYQGHPGARWEFIYTPESGEPMHVLQQAYIDDEGTEYTIYVEARHRLWDSGTEQVFTTALNTWKQP